jgi:hypothetical protein
MSTVAFLMCLLARQEDHQHHQHQPAPKQSEIAPAPEQPHQEVSSLPPGFGGVASLEAMRNASGTAWQPFDTPHAGWHLDRGAWRLMLHGLLFGGFDWQAGPRGGKAGVGLGWVMAMLARQGRTNQIALRTMLSPEPWTVRGGGYPLLLQSGETYQGQPLHDRQHPHDLLMELGALYTQELVPAFALQGYAALAGEPALGPVAFPHRASALADPLATLGHHWLDSTHISFGVFTLGLVGRRVKLEGSWFNGREPDERRWDVDLRAPDSWAARLSVMPVDQLVGQVSYGHMPSPHGGGHHHGGMDRATASVTHHLKLQGGGLVATLLAFGLNRAGGRNQPAVLAESMVDLDGANVAFARAEVVEKSGHDLVLPAPLDAEDYRLLSFAVGYLRNLPTVASIIPGVGLRVSGNHVPAALGPAYGGRRFPLGAMLYVRLLPAAPHH